MLTSTLVALAASFSFAYAQIYQGFNYGSTHSDNSAVVESDYQSDFTTAQNVVGTSGFTSARIYTMIQAGTTNTPTEAIQAAINTKTSLLLGLWASAGQAGISSELAALSSAISQFGTAFTDLIIGISVGSEDLYRISPTGIENMSGVGASPDDITNYIGQVRSAISGTAASGKPVGHVDTWTAWVNSSNDAVISASDFIGMDAYPYFQNTMTNAITDGYSLFFAAYDATVDAVGGKPVWVTETGWPVSGATENLAVPSLQNAQTYWDQVGCGRLFGNVNTWWYTLQDAFPTTPDPSFGIVGTTLSDTPLYDLSCSGVSSSTSTAATADASASSLSAEAASVQEGGATEGAPSTIAAANAGSSQASPLSASGSPSATPAAAPADTATTSPVAQSPAAPQSSAAPVPTTLATVTQTTVLPSASAVAESSCPASLSGTYEYPHLIVPLNKDQPDTAGGTSYNGTMSPSISSVFNFDIPSSDAGKTCTLIFFFPTQDELTTSAFSLSGSGGFDVAQLTSVVTQETSYSTCPATESDLAGPSSVTPGNEYVIASGSCAAGQTLSYLVSATGSLDLSYFQDSGASPIGFFITVC
ncbi:hypothetical protein MMC28_003860 [Mycoblastus sanguinarius]|nr:hypothetical protein [Mycoblastus sanguinarius]